MDPILNVMEEAKMENSLKKSKKKEKVITFGDVLLEHQQKNDKKLNEMVEKTAANIGKAAAELAPKLSKSSIPDTPGNRADLMRQIQQFRDAPLYCTPIVKSINMDSPFSRLVGEVESYKDELAKRRSTKFVHAVPPTVFKVAETTLPILRDVAQLPGLQDVDLTGLTKNWEKMTVENPDLNLVMAELSITYGSYFKMRPEYVLLQSMAQCVQQTIQGNKKTSSPVNDAALKDYEDL